MISIILLLSISISILTSIQMSATLPTTERIVILGAGIHGASTAYYLFQLGYRSTIIEKTSIGAAASGKAGGFLAREWGRGPTTQLHTVSFDLHSSLATELGIESYRKVTTLSVNGNKKGSVAASWLDGKATSSLMEGATAQVTPMELTSKLITASNAEVLFETAEGLILEAGRVRGVNLRGKDTLEADVVLVALGPWSAPFIQDNFGVPCPMEGVKSTSLLYEVCSSSRLHHCNPRVTSISLLSQGMDIIKKEPFACFCDEDSNGCHLVSSPATYDMKAHTKLTTMFLPGAIP